MEHVNIDFLEASGSPVIEFIFSEKGQSVVLALDVYEFDIKLKRWKLS